MLAAFFSKSDRGWQVLATPDHCDVRYSLNFGSKASRKPLPTRYMVSEVM
jgi:hypothetical protein